MRVQSLTQMLLSEGLVVFNPKLFILLEEEKELRKQFKSLT